MKSAKSLHQPAQSAPSTGGDELITLLNTAVKASPSAAVITGELVAIAGEGRSPLVTYPEQPGSNAIAARSVVDLHGAHIGHAVVLLFDGGDPHKPIIMGVLRDGSGWPLPERVGQVEVSANGERMVLSAKQQLVLRCGRASITLTDDGKVTIDGTYVCSKSSGVNRIKGGSVQLN